jgi:hypothetical protein
MGIVLYATYLYGTPDKKATTAPGEPRSERRNPDAQDAEEEKRLVEENKA